MGKLDSIEKLGKITSGVLAGVVQLAACVVVYFFNVPNPNIVLFVLMTAALVQFGYLAGTVSGVITFLYSAFFFSTAHSWIYYTPLNLNKLQQALQAANRANEAKTTFLLNMSHDIRTPLNGIMGLLKIDELHFDNRQLVLANHKKMMVAAEHLLSLINDVLQGRFVLCTGRMRIPFRL